MAADKNMRITTPDGEPAGRGLKRFVITVIIIVVILYVGAFFGLKTDGARNLIEGVIGKKVGTEVSIGTTKLAFPLGITMTGLTAGDIAGGAAGFLAEEVTIKYLSGAGTTVKARGAEVVLVRDADGIWGPRFFSKLGDLPESGIQGVSGITEGVRGDFSIFAKDAVIKWRGNNGGQVITDGVDFEMRPVKLPSGQAYYYKLEVFKCASEGVDGPSGKDISREWLATDEAAYIELSSDGELDGLDGAAGIQMMEINDEDQ